MKLLHFSDTHLGFSEYHRIDPQSGLNQRERDFYAAWEKVIDTVFEHRPDVVVHAGDLFHTPRPSNRAIRVALEGIQRLSDAGIPLVMVSGNHETPRIRSTGSIFEAPALFPNVFAAFSGRLQRFRVRDVDFYCLPHCSLTEELEQALEALKAEVESSSAPRVLVSHGAWTSKSFYGMGEFNEQRLPDLEAAAGVSFDYIALGHYHRCIEVKQNACYSGSTERTGFNDHGSRCGYLLVDLESGERVFHPLAVRPMIKAPAMDCTGKMASAVYDELEAFSRTVPEGAVVQIVLENLSDDLFLRLDLRRIDELFSQTLYLEKQLFRSAPREGDKPAASAIRSLPVEFEAFLQKQAEGGFDMEKMRRLGEAYLQE